MIRRRISINGNRIDKKFKNEYSADVWLSGMIIKYSDKSLIGEKWKDIPNYSGYQASVYGRIASKNYKRSGIFKVLTPATSKDGYLKTMLLRDDGKYRTQSVHRLVLSAFKGASPDLTGNHLDGIKTNNYLSNLEWCTRSENCLHAVRTGLWEIKSGEKNGMSKLTRDQVNHARILKKTKGRFWGRNKLAIEWGISPKHLQKIVNDYTLWPEK